MRRHLRLEGLAEKCRTLRQELCRLGERADLVANRGGDRCGNVQLVRMAVVCPVPGTPVLREVRSQRLSVKWITPARLEHDAKPRPIGLRQKFPNRLLRKACERDCSRGLVVRRQREYVGETRCLSRSPDEHHQYRRLKGMGQEERYEPERRAVRPVQVVEDQ